jgi:hypothetical protein
MNLIVISSGLFLLNYVLFVLCDIEIADNFKECTIGSISHELNFDDQCKDPFQLDTFQSKFLKTGLKNSQKAKDDNYFPYVPKFMIPLEEKSESRDELKSELSIDLYSYHKFWIVHERQFFLEEIGYECKVFRHDITFSKDILFNPYTETVSSYEKLSKNQCLTMIADKECYGNKMICPSGNECKFKPIITAEYPNWFGRNRRQFFECEYHARPVTAHRNQARVVDEAKEPCTATDGYCVLENSVVIWDNTKLNKCQYEKILFIDDGYNINEKSPVYMSFSHKYLFQLKSNFFDEMCGVKFYKTYEGVDLVFLSPNDRNNDTMKKILDLPQSKFSVGDFASKLSLDMSLSELDFTQYVSQEETALTTCSMIVNLIRSSLDKDDTFLNLNFPGNSFHSSIIIDNN